MICSKCGAEIKGTYCAECGIFNSSSPEQAIGAILAGWWQRVGATLIDSLLLLLPVIILNLVLGAIIGTICGFAVQGTYMVTLLARPDGQTIGNRVAQTRVRDALSGNAISLQQSLKRWGLIAAYSAIDLTGQPDLVLTVSLIGVIDCLYPLFDRRNQTLHDKFAGTVVVRL